MANFLKIKWFDIFNNKKKNVLASNKVEKTKKTSSLIKDNIYSEKNPDDYEKNIYMLLIDL